MSTAEALTICTAHAAGASAHGGGGGGVLFSTSVAVLDQLPEWESPAPHLPDVEACLQEPLLAQGFYEARPGARWATPSPCASPQSRFQPADGNAFCDDFGGNAALGAKRPREDEAGLFVEEEPAKRPREDGGEGLEGERAFRAGVASRGFTRAVRAVVKHIAAHCFLGPSPTSSMDSIDSEAGCWPAGASGDVCLRISSPFGGMMQESLGEEGRLLIDIQSRDVILTADDVSACLMHIYTGKGNPPRDLVLAVGLALSYSQAMVVSWRCDPRLHVPQCVQCLQWAASCVEERCMMVVEESEDMGE
eukprot:CAMPEP_0206227656 /NCGR_PEP_ID=MMETSP0047_2-20121206/8745_1 /ASSEMBLY_ACC=CAM_ASM_000192 /TAXON_ID=195065 /ORGANISM="Chroomonas mesostigmatica_cf, Strain CCMP1168" /LENGTH=305 /DNA_ID=CAMNT_0053650833 /DNA_START=20 /DNA_END=937 /DNA_ORIENTATION=+